MTTLLYETISGSRAYGTAIEGSDTDRRGVFVDLYTGFLPRNDTTVEMQPHDRTLFELRKFFRMASQANPNVLELLFTEPSDHLTVHHAFAPVLERRSEFLSKRAVNAYRGFATSEFSRLLRKWDDKAAMHFVRLTRMCLELLREGTLRVRRSDAEELIAIRRGSMTLEKLRAYSLEVDDELMRVAERSMLPSEPDVDALDRLCVDVVHEVQY